MTSASVALHESNLSLHADTLVLCWTHVHHGKVMRHRKPDEWRITCACARAGRWCTEAGCEAGRALPAVPTALAWQPPPNLATDSCSPRPALSPEAADSRQKRNRPQQMGPLTLAGPSKHCVLVTCHLLLFSGLTTPREGGLSVFWVRHKRERGEEKLTRPLFTAAQILWKSRHKRRARLRANKSRAPPSPTKKLSCTPTAPFTTPLLIKHSGPPGGDKKERPYPQKLMQRKCMYKGHLQFYKMADIMLLLKNEDLPYCVGVGKSMAGEEKWRKIMLAWFTTNR